MNKRKKTSLIAAVLCCMATIQAAEAANAWSAELNIEGVITNPAGGFLLLLPASNPACGSSGNQFNVTVGVNSLTADGAKVALAQVLTAYAMGKKIIVLFDSAIAGCPVQQVYLKP
jgi:hypothetical protein